MLKKKPFPIKTTQKLVNRHLLLLNVISVVLKGVKCSLYFTIRYLVQRIK